MYEVLGRLEKGKYFTFVMYLFLQNPFVFAQMVPLDRNIFPVKFHEFLLSVYHDGVGFFCTLEFN